MARISEALLCFAALLGNAKAGKDGFLGSRPQLDPTTEFRDAMGTVMGCGGEVDREQLGKIKANLLPMWTVIPKNDRGLVEWKMVRYVAHRYFVQKYSLLVKGFEPMQQINSSFLGSASIMGSRATSIVDEKLMAQPSARGYSIDDLVAMIATLEQLIRDDESTLLQEVFVTQKISLHSPLNSVDLADVVEIYMLFWMMDGDMETINALIRKPTLRTAVIPKWDEIKKFISGLLKQVEFERHQTPKPGHALLAWSGKYSFEDAHSVVSTITKTFASFWENECQTIKQDLLALDKTGTGRVNIADFYGANADGEWRFGESEEYLRELGSLDESSPSRGKQVIVPNYLQGASNCIVATAHYLVCCVNECETVLNEIEDTIGGPLALPEEVIPLVGNMTGLDDELTSIDASLRDQLRKIADLHGGKIPLHGRLFAQWLHYVFPRECPFPHKSGAHSSKTPLQFGEGYIASEDTVKSHANDRQQGQTTEIEQELQDAHRMSQWSEEEELLSEYANDLEAPWARRTSGLFGVLGLVCVVLLVGSASGIFIHQEKKTSAFETKSVFV